MIHATDRTHSSATSQVRLKLTNFLEWRKSIERLCLNYGEAGKMVRSKIRPSFVEPDRLDMSTTSPPWRIVKAADYYRHLQALQARATDEEETIGIKNDY